jgi:DNA-binding response OmpR family regulator
MANILIAEDDSLISQALTAILEDDGHRIIGPIACASEILPAAMEAKPDLLLIDVQLSDTGCCFSVIHDVLVRMSAPILIMSGKEWPGLMLPFLRKPFAPSDLRATVDRLLEEHRTLIELRFCAAG